MAPRHHERVAQPSGWALIKHAVCRSLPEESGAVASAMLRRTVPYPVGATQ